MTDNRTGSGPLHTARVRGGATVVTLHGEIDLLTATPLSSRLDVLTAGPRPDLVLDLRTVDFIDCAGLGVLCRVRNRVQARDGRLRLVTDSIGFRRLLRATGLTDVFEVHSRLPECLGGGTPPGPRAASAG
ncbi:STAS domain-containing protein [Streptomyces sp. NPDC006012]|uniref:STAS domain-containing protein n=1 Tax=Streptomyces sp. NPDC006012 TaxID=3364739 RepID=UPI0036C3DE58